MKAMAAYATQNNVLLVIGILLLVALGVYGYYKYTKRPKYIDNNEYDSKKSPNQKSKSIDVYYFYVDWCPHCKKARPIWNQLKNEMPTVNGRTINYFEIDCEDTDNGGRQTANKFEVTGYPTIKMVNNKQIIEYDAKPELDTLKQFIKTAA